MKIGREVPVGPLLELAERWERVRDDCKAKGQHLIALAFDLHAYQLRSLLAPPTGQAPESLSPSQEDLHA